MAGNLTLLHNLTTFFPTGLGFGDALTGLLSGLFVKNPNLSNM